MISSKLLAKVALTLTFFSFILNLNYSQCPANINYSRQEQVDEFPSLYPNCNAIPGDVYIGGVSGTFRDISNLDSLAQITSIGGSLTFRLNDFLSNTVGLQNITSIGDDVVILRNEQLTDLSFLSNIRSIPGEISIENNDNLQSLSGLESVGSCRRLEIIGNDHPAFNTLNGLSSLDSTGSVRIQYNENLLSLSGLESLRIADGTFICADLPSLNSLDGTENMIRAEGLRFVRLDNLSALNGFGGLKEIGELLVLECNGIPNMGNLAVNKINRDLRIEKNNNLLNLQGLSKLTSVGALKISDNSNLTNLEGLKEDLEFNHEDGSNKNLIKISGNSSLKNLSGIPDLVNFRGDISIINNQQLESISNLNNIKFLNTLEISENPSLKTLADIATIEGLGSLILKNNSKCENLPQLFGDTDLFLCEIINNDGLMSLQGFEDIQSISTLVLNSNSSLESLFGFENLTSISNDLKIDSNAMISHLTGLESLESVGGDLSITENKELEDCSAICTLINNNGVAGSITLDNNVISCNTLDTLLATCVDTITEITISDIILDLIYGDDEFIPLQGAELKIYEGENLIQSHITNDDGVVSLNTNEFKEEITYILELKHPDNLKITLRHEFDIEDLETDLEYDFPLSLLATIIQQRDSLASRQIKVDLLGGALPWTYQLEKYDMSFIDLTILEWELIETEHQLTFEKMKRMGLGLNAMNAYLDHAIFYGKKLGKALIDGTFNLFELIQLNSAPKGLKEALEKFNKEQEALEILDADSKTIAAIDKAVNSFYKSAFKLYKAYKIDPYLASLSKSPKDQLLAQQLNAVIKLIELLLDRGGSTKLIKDAFWEIVYEAVTQKLIEYLYVSIYTQETLNTLSLKVENPNIEFNELVSQTNAILKATQDENKKINNSRDFFENSSSFANSLSDNLATLSVAITLYSGGSLAPYAASLHAVSKGLKYAEIVLSGINLHWYSHRFGSLDNELNKIILETNFSELTTGEHYPTGYLDNLLEEFLLSYGTWESFIMDWKNALLEGTSEECSEKYLLAKSHYEQAIEPKHEILHRTLINFGGQSNLNGEVDTIFFRANQASRKIEIYRTFLDIEMLAYLADTTDLTIKEEFSLELDTLILMGSELVNSFELLFESHENTQFEHLIVASNISYPDSLSENFSCTFSIQNVGPEISPPFSMTIAPNDNMDIQIFQEGITLDTFINDLELEFGEEMEFEVNISPLEINKFLQLNLTFNGARAIDQSIPFVFNNQNFGALPSNTFEVHQENKLNYFYPNPATDIIIRNNSFYANGEVIILNIFGQKVQSFKDFKSQYNINNLPSGIYFIKIVGIEGMQKIVKI